RHGPDRRYVNVIKRPINCAADCSIRSTPALTCWAEWPRLDYAACPKATAVCRFFAYTIGQFVLSRASSLERAREYWAFPLVSTPETTGILIASNNAIR